MDLDLPFVCIGVPDEHQSIERDIPSHIECHLRPQRSYWHTLSLYTEYDLSSRSVGESESPLRFLCLVFSSDATDIQICGSGPIEFSHFLKQVISQRQVPRNADAGDRSSSFFNRLCAFHLLAAWHRRMVFLWRLIFSVSFRCALSPGLGLS